MISRTTIKILLPIAAVLLGGAAFLEPAGATQPALQSVSAGLPTFHQAAAPTLIPLTAVVAPVTVLGHGTSVMPPGPASGAICSTNFGGGFCSVSAPNVHCSAFNDNGNLCSTIEAVPAACSVAVSNRACSVLPPTQGGNPSQCTSFADGANHQCSAIGIAPNLRCTTKGQGQSTCSAHTGLQGLSGGFCSVFNPSASQRSFCSTKLNVPLLAKNCSTFTNNSQCSIQVGGKGQCTTFGAASPGSCSAFVSGTHCSVMGGGAGNPCVQ